MLDSFKMSLTDSDAFDQFDKRLLVQPGRSLSVCCRTTGAITQVQPPDSRVKILYAIKTLFKLGHYRLVLWRGLAWCGTRSSRGTLVYCA